MKQNDIILIIVMVFIGGVLSFFISKTVITSPKNRKEKVETVQAISSDFNQPSNTYFNKNSLDPTQLIKIGDNNNNQPFNQ
jgi:hypothetical protein